MQQLARFVRASSTWRSLQEEVIAIEAYATRNAARDDILVSVRGSALRAACWSSIRSPAPAFIACTLIGMSPRPVMEDDRQIRLICDALLQPQAIEIRQADIKYEAARHDLA